MSYFDDLYAVNVNGKTEERNGLTYLSWANAIAEVLKRYPDMTYKVRMFDGKPYVYDALTGYMVFTEVTIEGITREMWLPVMDSANRALKDKPYTISNKFGKETTVAAATMFDINKTIMRCLTKNFGMFGLGLYIYAGEDLPEVEAEQVKADEKAKAEEQAKKDAEKAAEAKKIAINALKTRMQKDNVPDEYLLGLYKVKSFDDLSAKAHANINTNWDKIVAGVTK